MKKRSQKQVKNEEKGRRVGGKMKKKVEKGKWVMEKEVVERVEKSEEKGKEEERRDKKVKGGRTEEGRIV